MKGVGSKTFEVEGLDMSVVTIPGGQLFFIIQFLVKAAMQPETYLNIFNIAVPPSMMLALHASLNFGRKPKFDMNADKPNLFALICFHISMRLCYKLLTMAQYRVFISRGAMFLADTNDSLQLVCSFA